MPEFDPNELLSRQVPQSLEAEQAVLGAMLIDSKCVSTVVGLLHPEDFYLRQNREIYETIYKMFNFSQVIDPVTVLNKLKENGYHEPETAQYLAQLMEITYSSGNAREYANIVRDKALLRRLAQAAAEIEQAVYAEEGTAAQILEAAERRVFSLRRGDTDEELEHIGVTINRLYSQLYELSQSDKAFPGHATGFRGLDKKINGLNNSDLIILAARPSMGKTSFALNLLANVAKKTGKAVAFFSLEMSKEQLAARLLANESFVDNTKLSTGQHINDDDWQKIALSASALSQTDIRLNDNPTITVAQINALCRRVENLGLIVVDYLQLMTSPGDGTKNENRVQLVSSISRALKIMAKDLRVPVICLSQLSRAAETRADKRPILADLRESGAIEQDADQVLLLYRDDYYNKESEEKNIMECIVAKNRHGETGTVKLQWLPQFFALSDLETAHSE